MYATPYYECCVLYKVTREKKMLCIWKLYAYTTKIHWYSVGQKSMQSIKNSHICVGKKTTLESLK